MSNSRYFYLECATNPYCYWYSSLFYAIELSFDAANVVQFVECSKCSRDFLPEKVIFCGNPPLYQLIIVGHFFSLLSRRRTTRLQEKEKHSTQQTIQLNNIRNNPMIYALVQMLLGRLNQISVLRLFSQLAPVHLTPKSELRKSCWDLCDSQRVWK